MIRVCCVIASYLLRYCVIPHDLAFACPTLCIRSFCVLPPLVAWPENKSSLMTWPSPALRSASVPSVPRRLRCSFFRSQVRSSKIRIEREVPRLASTAWPSLPSRAWRAGPAQRGRAVTLLATQWGSLGVAAMRPTLRKNNNNMHLFMSLID